MREVCRVGSILLPHSVDSFSLHKRAYHATRHLLSATPNTPPRTPPPVLSNPTATTVTADAPSKRSTASSKHRSSPSSDDSSTKLVNSTARTPHRSVPQPRQGAPTTPVAAKTSVYTKKVIVTDSKPTSASNSHNTSTIYTKISNIVTATSTVTNSPSQVPPISATFPTSHLPTSATPSPFPSPSPSPSPSSSPSPSPSPSPSHSPSHSSSTSTSSVTTATFSSSDSTTSIISAAKSVSTVSTASATLSISTTASMSTATVSSKTKPSISASSTPSFLSPNPLGVTSPFDETPSSLLPDPSKFTIERLMVSPYNSTVATMDKPTPKGPRFSILQYNILITQIDVAPQYYYCPEYAQSWEYRGPNLVREIRGYNSDIICLQEVDKFEYFNTAFAQDGYTGIYTPRPYKHLDGLALFYKKDKFKLIKQHVINYNKIHMPTKDPTTYFLENRFGFINRGRSKYETNNVALVCELETLSPNTTPRRLFVATTHIYWNPKMPELKVLQSYTLLKELEKILQVAPLPGEKAGSKSSPSVPLPPLVITGDFNCNPTSGMYQLYSTQKLPHTHADVQSLVLKDLSHSLPIQSAYSGLGEPLTNITKGFVGTLDYIWYGSTQLGLNRVLSPLTAPDLFLPNLEFSSDHAALMCELDFLV